MSTPAAHLAFGIGISPDPIRLSASAASPISGFERTFATWGAAAALIKSSTALAADDGGATASACDRMRAAASSASICERQRKLQRQVRSATSFVTVFAAVNMDFQMSLRQVCTNCDNAQTSHLAVEIGGGTQE